MNSPSAHPFIKWFADITIGDVPLVGGKNASLGEMVRELASKGVKPAPCSHLDSRLSMSWSSSTSRTVPALALGTFMVALSGRTMSI